MPPVDDAMRLRPTRAKDLEFVLALERHDDNRPFLNQWTREQHAAAAHDRSMAHWIAEVGGLAVGYIILAGLGAPGCDVELRRIVIGPKRSGFGRAALRLVKRFAFEQVGAHRLWLDVFDHNHRARALYAAEGFKPEGVLRECVEKDGRLASLHVLSILASEYRLG
jgi:RimJ/RimL family protein N-acetyltransferase